MKIINKKDEIYTLRLDTKEELIDTLQNFCEHHGIHFGWFEAIGSTRELQLAYFNVEKMQYVAKDLIEFLEILNITGNIALKEGKVFAHAHGIFSRADMSTLGGHVNSCVISQTAEVVLRASIGEVKREFDEEAGLHLLS